jgi:hypothetical protein
MSKLPYPSWARPLFLINALVAWSAVGVSFTLMAIGYYIDEVDPSKPTLLGNIPTGKDQVWERFFDWSSYFTILSNIVVAIVMTMLVLRPHVFFEKSRRGRLWQALRLDSVLMITITGVVYQLLLATGDKTGWDFISDTLQHAVNPVVTVLVWLVAGPRGILQWRTIAAAMVVPIVWALYSLSRGAVVGAYPYFFLDVATNGLASVIAFIVQIMIAAIVISMLFLAYEKVVSRKR